MKIAIRHYTVTPAVLRAGESCTLTVHPRGENTAFLPDFVYTVTVSSVEATTVRYDRRDTTVYSLRADENGNLTFTHFFPAEGRYVLRLSRPAEDNKTCLFDITHRQRRQPNSGADLNVYALDADLYGIRRAFKGELHTHTCYSDGIQDPAHAVGNYRRAGFDFLAITDHYVSEGSERAMELFADAPVHMTLLRGEEAHVPTEYIHAVHVGGRDSVNRYFRAHPEEVRAEVLALASTLNLPPDVDPEDYAWRVWIARKAQEFGGVAILAHPHWVWFGVYFMTEATTRQLLRDGIYDALELLNNTDTGSGTNEIDTALSLWEELRCEGLRIPVVGSSDCHDTAANPPACPANYYTLAFAPDRSPAALLDAIRSGRCVAVDEQAPGLRAFGDNRLVKYARFLLTDYFPQYAALVAPEGDLLAERSDTGADNRQLLALLDERAEAFVKTFFGQ